MTKKRGILAGLVVLMFLLTLTGCGSKLSGTFNAYGESILGDGSSLSDSALMTLTIDGKTATLQTTAHTLGGSGIDESAASVTGTVDTGAKTIAFTKNGKSGKIHYALKDKTLTLSLGDSTMAFAAEGSSAFTRNKRDFKAEASSLKDEVESQQSQEDDSTDDWDADSDTEYDDSTTGDEASSTADTDAAQNTMTMAESERTTFAETLTQTILPELKDKLAGTWKFSDHESSWTTDAAVTLTVDGKLTSTLKSPLPDYLKTVVQTSGTYTVDEAKLTADIASSAALKDLSAVQDLSGLIDADSSLNFALNFTATETGTREGKKEGATPREGVFGFSLSANQMVYTDTFDLFASNNVGSMAAFTKQ
ncbi:hypothetical protein [Lacticaseibacillus kribbianus]|uniref:hypothetical protein n=1 Tax=Lacticaseibacillus kribbianus TaxID=2926292 RepID=UPI001CD20437|nr:hypothetical protein [Lacticaseibacillus kribbianus]